MRRTKILLTIMFAVLIPVWIFLVAPKLTPRIPANWEWQVNIVGFQNWADRSTNQWAEDILILINVTKSKVRAEQNTAIIKDTYQTRNAQTGNVEWEYSTEFTVDKRTGMNLKNDKVDRSGCWYVFPRHTKKKTYLLWTSYLKKVPLSFVKEERIGGLRTYLFQFSGDTEYTESYTGGSEEYPGLVLKENQEIRSGERFVLRYWVEPISGAIVRTEESGAEDCIVDTRTKKELSKVVKWGGETAGEAVVVFADIARARKGRILLIYRYIPAGFAVLATILFFTSIRTNKNKT